MTRTPVPAEFSSGPSPASLKYARDLLRQKNLMANRKWLEQYGDLDAEAYAAHLKSTSEDMETWDQKKISRTIDWLKGLPWLPRSSQPANTRELPSPETLPAGHYAVENEDGELRFYHLWRGTRKPTYVKLYVEHGPEDSEIPFRSVPTILAKIVEAGPFEAATRYGREIGSCGICATRLTNTLSRELGIGPVCGGRYFESDPDAWKTQKKNAREAIRARGEDPEAEV